MFGILRLPSSGLQEVGRIANPVPTRGRQASVDLNADEFSSAIATTTVSEVECQAIGAEIAEAFRFT